MEYNPQIKPLPFYKSFLLFCLPSLFFYFIAYIVIPYFEKELGFHPLLAWFYGGILVFVLLFGLVLIIYRLEYKEIRVHQFLERLRVKKLSKRDLKLIAIATALIFFITLGIKIIARFLMIKTGIPDLETAPPFINFRALIGFEKLYLLIWVPSFILNIIGEELLWRGYALPRQELEHGKWAWFINSILWTTFHLCFGVDLLIILMPALFIIPLIVYKTKNTTVGIITHALVNGPAFILLSLGIIKP